MIKYVIFDKDGTLLDTEKLFKKAWIRASADWGLSDPESLYPQLVGRAEALIVDILKNTYGGNRDYWPFFEHRNVYLREYINEEIPLKSGCIEILDFLKCNGIKMALATSTRREMAHSNLKRVGIFDYFDAIVTGDMIENGKPNPDIFLLAGKLIGADPSQTIVCEDSYTGIIGADRAGMKPVMVIDQLEPTPEIEQLAYAIGNSLFDVIELIKKENNII